MIKLDCERRRLKKERVLINEHVKGKESNFLNVGRQTRYNQSFLYALMIYIITLNRVENRLLYLRTTQETRQWHNKTKQNNQSLHYHGSYADFTPAIKGRFFIFQTTWYIEWNGACRDPHCLPVCLAQSPRQIAAYKIFSFAVYMYVAMYKIMDVHTMFLILHVSELGKEGYNFLELSIAVFFLSIELHQFDKGERLVRTDEDT